MEQNKQMNKRLELLGVLIDPLTMQETVSRVEAEYILPRKALHLMGVNADKINQCADDPQMRDIVNACGIINADGASVVLASRYLGNPLPERVAGIDLMQELLNLANQKGYSVYFLGAKEEVLQDMLLAFKTTYPALQVAGARNGYFTADEEDQIARELAELQPDMVFVGITSPKKEYLIQSFMDQGVDAVYMGVGGSFDVLSGHIARAPKWVQSLHLEWFFRLINEPKRLFKRYLVGNSRFIRAVIAEKYKKK